MAKKNQSNDVEKQIDDGRKNEENGGSMMVVLKTDLHCQGCAGKVIKAIRSFDGVESAKIGDIELKKITVIGEVDPDELRRKVEEKIKKKVDLISQTTKKVKFSENDNQFGGGERKKQQNQQTAAMKDEIKPKKFPVTTTVLKVPLDCQGCIEKIQKIVSKTKGFVGMSVDKTNDLVTVKGGIDVKALTKVLEDKLKRKVEIVPPKKDSGSGNGGGKKKEKGGAGEGGGKENGIGGRGGRMEEDKMDMEHYVSQGHYMHPPYVNRPDYMLNYVYATQMFNDENPNAACVVM